ncbi:MAG TPA: diacylglycerol kinase family protein [Verrucomicrobiae bacterium]|nr:diacylglycerol kinase family protein [Verrucomicrobiae bacterium]
MRTCVIFNPAARGNKARHFRRHLDAMAGQSAFKATTAPGDARRLASEAVADKFDLIVAAGGDGTVNEVLNGISDAPNGFESARLGVLPLGTVNVFARELKIPLKLERAWDVLRCGNERRIDLPRAEFSANGKIERRYFIQLAGAGFDARAIELVDFSVKKKIGPLAYVIAGLKVLREQKPQITARGDVRPTDETVSGELILIGNGKFYGGPISIFPQADLTNGLLDVCIFPKINFPTLIRCLPALIFKQELPERIIQRLRAKKFELSSESKTAFELDGEWVGHLPVTFSVERQKLRVVC